MKLRVKIRSSGSRHSITVDQPDAGEATLDHVKNAIYRQIPSLDVENADGLVLSLNGSAPLENDADDPLSEIGLVAGDLVHVINGGNAAVNPSSSSSSSSSSRTQPPASQSRSFDLLDNSTGHNFEQFREATRSGTAERVNGVISTDGRSAADVDDDADSELLLPRASYSVLTAEERRGHMTRHASCADYADGDALPPLLAEVFRIENPGTKPELLLLVVHVVLLERNFSLVDDGRGAGPAAVSTAGGGPTLPSDWKGKVKNKLTLVYTHPKCGDGVEFLLTFINMFGNIVVIQAKARTRRNDDDDGSTETTTTSTDSFKCQLKPDEFLTLDCLTASDSARKYRDLRRLSTTLLDAVVRNLLNEGMSLVGLDDDDVSIFSLPYDVSVKLLAMLDFRSLARMARVNKFFRDFCATSQFLWKNLFLRDFSAIPLNGGEEWKTEYKETYLRRRAMEERRRNPSFLSDPILHNPFHDDNPFAPPPFGPPGFLGGDRDLFPEGLPLPNDPFGRGGGGGGGGGLFLPPRLPRPPGPRMDPMFPGGRNPLRPRWPGPGGGGGHFF